MATEKTIRLNEPFVVELFDGELKTFLQQKQLAEYLKITQPQATILIREQK